MARDSKKVLYENIMTSVAKQVKKALNEYEGWTTTTTLDKYHQEQDFVDLGLSVKWAKYNLGANPGKNAESWYGDYYAWGETEPNKSRYVWNNYKHIDSMENFLKYSEKDHKNTLVPNDDAATVNYGRPWRIPTQEECKELLSLPSRWVTNYKGIQGLKGRIFTGTNGNTLFIPAAGFCNRSNIYDICSYCLMWSSSLNLDRPRNAYYLCFDSSDTSMGYIERCFGLSVRPVMA